MEETKISKRKRIYYRCIKFFALGFLIMNLIAFFHAYKFTHFSTSTNTKTQKPESLNTYQKISALLFGVSNPRPVNLKKPDAYTVLSIKGKSTLECWYKSYNTSAKDNTSKGTVVIFHGYGGEKSSNLDKANIFDSLQYNTLLVDFTGSGGSDGNTTTLGFKEAEQVFSTFQYLKQRGENNIILFGTSMGAVAIMKALYDYNIIPKAIILECPFGSMYQTVSNRFDNMHVPQFPMAGLLVFWGGVQNGFWAFNHIPIEYAKSIHTPTLVIYGAKDKNVRRQEIDSIFQHLPSKKQLKIYPNAGHENYLIRYQKEWIKDISSFLNYKTN